MCFLSQTVSPDHTLKDLFHTHLNNFPSQPVLPKPSHLLHKAQLVHLHGAPPTPNKLPKKDSDWCFTPSKKPIEKLVHVLFQNPVGIAGSVLQIHIKTDQGAIQNRRHVVPSSAQCVEQSKHSTQ